MVPIKTFALVLRNAAGSHVSDEEENYVPSLDPLFKHYCRVSTKQKNENSLKCQQATAAMAIHGIYEFLRKQKLFEYDSICKNDRHNLCKEREQMILRPCQKNEFIVYKPAEQPNDMANSVLLPKVTASNPVPDAYSTPRCSRRSRSQPTNRFYLDPSASLGNTPSGIRSYGEKRGAFHSGSREDFNNSRKDFGRPARSERVQPQQNSKDTRTI